MRLGELTLTSGVAYRTETDEKFMRFVNDSFEKYKNLDWGDTRYDDYIQNTWAANHGERVMAEYKYSDEEKIWIVTEWDRSCTTILFPEEY